ncbi:MAG: NUDIX hydrolase [Candidatus Woesebacteria bacterium]|nr:MAG: NUDIX hydrolase [Candidatus Woesebacteria bacterium]
MNDWKTKSSKVVHKNPRFSVREDGVITPNGRDAVFYVIDRPSVVFIIPLTRDNEVYLIHLSRYFTKKSNWEIPAGSSDNQDELSAAKRELKEETGLVSKDWSKLGELEVAAGMTGQMSHVFVAKDVKLTKENEKAEEGIDDMKKVSFKEVLQMIENEEIVNGPSMAALMLAGLKLKLF